MKYYFEFRPYQRKFKQPLSTSHGLWEVRKGIILRLTDNKGCSGFGEIAPLTWFGSESFEEALEFCNQLPSEITADHVFAIPQELPACQFGFESACSEVTSTVSSVTRSITFSGLLPSGSEALQRWRELWNQGFRTFKWKIGIAALAEELNVFHELALALPPEAKLRLDANAGLSLPEAVEWLKACDSFGIEFLEQPLKPTEFDTMLNLSTQYSTKLALDESVANLSQLKACYQAGWRGIFVIKPAIAGSPKLLRQFCTKYEIDAVFSTVFETPIGKRAGLRLSAYLTNNNRAAGFGVAHWFANDDVFSEPEKTIFLPDEPCQLTSQEIWKRL